jgi:hypothetical protein
MDFPQGTGLYSTCFLLRLPKDVLSYISNYFFVKENQNKKIFQFCYDWQNFLCTNKQHFGHWKKESRIIVLNRRYAKLYYDSAEFRERVLQSILNPRHQLELVFYYESFPHSPEINLQLFNNVKRIAISGSGEECHITPNVLEVDTLVLFNSPSEDLSYWSAVKCLTLAPHRTINDNTIFDLYPMIGLESGWFKVFQCVNYHALSSLKSLEIQYCDSIVDVSCFRNIPKLALIFCPNITDVSSLENVNNLTLRGCQGITDVSSLGRVSTLDLSKCKNITDVSALRNVHTLDVSGCVKLLDLSALENVYSFRASGFRGNDVSGLKNVVILDICDSRKVSDITRLHALKELGIEGCKRIVDLTGLTLETLRVSGENCINIESIHRSKVKTLEISFVQDTFCDFPFWTKSSLLMSFNNLQELFLLDCHSLESIPSLPCLRSLRLESCFKFHSLPILPSLGYLSLSYCDNLTLLEILGSSECKFPIYFVLVRGCDDLPRVTVDRNIFDCHVILNDKLEIIEVNQQVGHLKIDRESTAVLKKITNQSLVVSLKFVGLEKDPLYQLNGDTDEIIFQC